MVFYPKSANELNNFLKMEVSPGVARRALAAIFVCLYGTEQEDGSVSFAEQKV